MEQTHYKDEYKEKRIYNCSPSGEFYFKKTFSETLTFIR